VSAPPSAPKPETPPLIGPAEHPRARSLIFTAKAWGGLGGFLVCLAGGVLAGAPLFGATARALAGGVVCYLIAWAAALSISRTLMRAEAQTAVDHVLERRRKQREALEAAMAAAAAKRTDG
jgi:hypothetical protein